MTPTGDTGVVAATPEQKSQRNKRKHCFGISSCEKDKKFSTENTPPLHKDEFPPIGDIVINENLTPESGTYRSWGDIMDEEDLKENFLKAVEDSKTETKHDLRSRRRLALTSLADKVADDGNKEKTNKSHAVSVGRKQIVTDIEKIQKRQRQIDIGKNTLEYGNYLKIVPRCKRDKIHPSTPDKYQVCSTRSWQGQLKVWRRKLHMFDSPETAAEFESQIDSILGISSRNTSNSDVTSGSSQVESLSQEDDLKECTYNSHTPL